MTRRSRIVLVVLAIIVFVPAAIAVFLASFDWNRAKPWVEARASKALGRDIAIGGDLAAKWHWRVESDGALHFAPGFGFSAGGVTIGNPAWAKRPRFAELEALDIDLRILPLLWHTLDIPTVRLVKPSIDLERRKDESNTWTFAAADDDKTASPWKVDIGEIAFGEGEVFVRDAERALDLHAEIKRMAEPVPFGQRVAGDDPTTRRDVIRRVGHAAAEKLRNASVARAERREKDGRDHPAPPPYEFEWKATGTMHGGKLSGNGRFGGVLALRDPKPFPVRADIDVGKTEIALTGTITDPTSPDALDMRLWISGPNLADLYAIAGVALPQTPPYATVGRLSGHFHPRRSMLRYEDFTARVGGSDLAGTLTYRSEGDKRPSLTGEVNSTLLQFRDLAAVVGGGTPEERAERGDTSTQPSDRVLPSEPFNVEHWRAMDADVRFTGKRVVRTQELPISDVDTHIRMDGGVLSLDPLNFGMAGGTVKAMIRIDSNASPPTGKVTVDAKALKLRRLFEKVDGLDHGEGEVDGDIKLAGRGDSLASLLGASNGALRLLVTDGEVSETLLEEAGLNVANIVVAKLKGDKLVRIDCGAAAFTVNDGTAKADLFVVDSENALVEVDGTIDLGKERLDLTLHPHTKGMRIFSLRSPLHVEGSFLHVDVSVDKKSLLVRGGGALGLGLIAAPLAALVPLIAPGGDEETKSCTPLVDELKQSKSETSKPAGDGADASKRTAHPSAKGSDAKAAKPSVTGKPTKKAASNG